MNPLYGLMLFGVAFFGFMMVIGVVKACRKKKKAYYISAVMSLSFSGLVASIVVSRAPRRIQPLDLKPSIFRVVVWPAKGVMRKPTQSISCQSGAPAPTDHSALGLEPTFA